MEGKKYFYSDGSNQFGPFTLSELKDQNITRKTLVWYEGMAQWQEAGCLAELSSLFNMTPPPVNPSVDNNTRPTPPRTWLLESILVTLFCCLPLGVVGIIYAAKVDTAYSRGDYEMSRYYSKEAGRWVKIGFWVTLVSSILYLILALSFASIPLFFLN
ncbi:MAG: CD225/dispanin family protein [Marinifilaceae bacterium]